MMEPMHLRRRRRVAPLIAAAAAAVALVGCNASRPSSATPGTESGLGPPVEQPAVGSEPAATADPGDSPTVPASDAVAGTSAPGSVATAPTGSVATNGTATTAPPGLATDDDARSADRSGVGRRRQLPPGSPAGRPATSRSGIAVSIDGVPVHAASFGVRNAPDAIPERRGRRLADGPRRVHHHEHDDHDVATATTGACRRDRPLPDREPVQGDHRDGDPAARRSRRAVARRAGRCSPRRRARGRRHRSPGRVDHGPSAARPHDGLQRVPQHVLRPRRRELPGSWRPRARRGSAVRRRGRPTSTRT